MIIILYDKKEYHTRTFKHLHHVQKIVYILYKYYDVCIKNDSVNS